MREKVKKIIHEFLEEVAPQEIATFDLIADDLIDNSIEVDTEIESGKLGVHYFGEDTPLIAQIVTPILIAIVGDLLKSGIQVTIEELTKWLKNNRHKAEVFEGNLHSSTEITRLLLKYLEKVSKNTAK